MKKGLFIFLILGVITASAQKPDPNFYEKISQTKIRQYLKSAHFKEVQSYADYDLYYQRMDWQFETLTRYIKGSVTSYFKSTIDGMNSIQFDLHSSLTVDSIISNHKQLSYTHTGNALTIDLPKTLNKNETDSLKVFYQGIPVSSTDGFGSFATENHNLTPVLWTLSEPYGAMEWWPCKQSLADKIDSIDIFVTSQEQYRAASNGVLVSDNVENGMRTCHWKHRYPIATYLVAIAVTNYEAYSDYLDLADGDSIEILNYVYPENLENAKNLTPKTVEIMNLYNDLVGIYPFANEKYGHAQFGWSGGMEHQTMSFMGSFGFELISHELAHQWFGDYITLGTWHDIWLNEGFATYLSGLAFENLLEDEWRFWKEVRQNSVLSQSSGSVYVSDTTSVPRIFSGRLSYNKGSYLLHMLRWILGDETFFNALKNYATDPKIINSFASHQQLVKHFEETTDTNLTEFFNDWYYGEGYPIYTLQYAQNETNELIITLSQETSHKSVSFFEMPVPVRLWNENSTTYKDYRLNNSFNNQIFRINPEFKISKIEIDPDLWILNKTGDILYNPDLTLSDDIQIYPNPTTDKVYYLIPYQNKLNSLMLYTIEGKILESVNPENNFIDLSPYARGSYILKFIFEDKHIEKKVIKQ